MTKNEQLQFVPIVGVMLPPQDAAQNEVEERKEQAISNGLKDRMLTGSRKLVFLNPSGSGS